MRDEKTVAWLLQNAEPDFAAFTRRLIPGLGADRVLGVRMPKLRAYAGALLKSGEAEGFLDALPHRYLEEDQLHAILLSSFMDYARLMPRLELFLPLVDNWASCDLLSPKAFLGHREELMSAIRLWLGSQRVYTRRFAVGMLMRQGLEGGYEASSLQKVAALQSEDYYVNMMRAWFFAEALLKCYDAALPYLEGRALDPFTHRKAIQKAIESRRVPETHKAYLKSLRA